MSMTDSELRLLLTEPAGDWLDEAKPDTVEHPDRDKLIAYHTDALPEGRVEAIRDHLEGCRRCIDLVLEIEGFVHPQEVAETLTIEEPAEAEARSRVARLRPVREPADSGSVRSSSGPGARLPRWAAAVAAALALAVIGLGAWSIGQQRQLAELTRPQPGAAIVDLYPPTAARGDAGPDGAVELPADGFATLVINLRDSGEARSYRVEIVDGADRVRWSAEGLTPSRLGTLRLGLPGGFLPPGEHVLRVYGGSGEESHWIETYRIRIR